MTRCARPLTSAARRFRGAGGAANGGHDGRRPASVVAVLALGALLVTGCTAAPDPAPSAPGTGGPATSAPPAPSADAETPDSDPAVLRPDADAESNRAFFQSALSSAWNGPERARTAAYTRALIDAGFDPAAMQATADRTAIGHDVDAIEVSVLWQGECLIGQASLARNVLTTTVLDPIDDESCLIGRTVPIEP